VSRELSSAEARRFEANWIERQHVDANGEWNPDRDEYSASYHRTRETAQRAAIRGSQRAGQCEWWSVSEQQYVHGQWIDVQRWTGDWSGFSERTYVNTIDEEVC